MLNKFKVCSPPVRTISVEKIAAANLPTAAGDFKIASYRSLTSSEEFVVLYKGEFRSIYRRSCGFTRGV